MTSDYYNKLEDDLRILIARTPGFSRTNALEMEEYLIHGEHGIAFEAYCDVVKSERKSIPSDLKQIIESLIIRMDTDPHFYEGIL